MIPIEDLFNSIADANIKGVEDAIRRGANMRIKMDGMYPLQRALLADAIFEKHDPKRIQARKILSIIEEKSEKVGLVFEKGTLVDKREQEREKNQKGIERVSKKPKDKDKGFTR